MSGQGVTSTTPLSEHTKLLAELRGKSDFVLYSPGILQSKTHLATAPIREKY